MNNISELISIIYSIGGQASTEAIAEAYGKKYKMPLMMIPKSVIETTLSSRKDLVRRNCASNQWELRSDTSKDILLISDNRFFPTIRAVMSEVFNKNVNLEMSINVQSKKTQKTRQHIFGFSEPEATQHRRRRLALYRLSAKMLQS